MNIKKLNEALNEVMQPYVNLKLHGIVDSDGYLTKKDFMLTLTASDIDTIIFTLQQYPNTEKIIRQFQDLQGLY